MFYYEYIKTLSERRLADLCEAFNLFFELAREKQPSWQDLMEAAKLIHDERDCYFGNLLTAKILTLMWSESDTVDREEKLQGLVQGMAATKWRLEKNNDHDMLAVAYCVIRQHPEIFSILEEGRHGSGVVQ